jgi:hypothetical protein
MLHRSIVVRLTVKKDDVVIKVLAFDSPRPLDGHMALPFFTTAEVAADFFRAGRAGCFVRCNSSGGQYRCLLWVKSRHSAVSE